jgi:glutaredoxin
MIRHLVLYSRKDCCLCEDMKMVINRVARKMALSLEDIDVDSSTELRNAYGEQVPVLYIDGRKAFKYNVTARELERRLRGKADFADRTAQNGRDGEQS